MTPRERTTVALPDWKPVARDQRIRYTYVIPSSGRTTRHSDRWMRIPYQVASAALHTGATEFTVDGGVGTRVWVRTVTCTEEQADAWFREKIALPGGFQLKGEYRKALGGQQRRQARAGRGAVVVSETDTVLRAVRVAAKGVEDARRTLHGAMRVAKQDGASLRAIGEAAGLSPETVRTITTHAA